LRIKPVILILLLWAANCWGQAAPYPFPQHPVLRVVDLKEEWRMIEASRTGSRTRVNTGVGQDPFPFCAAAAASLLWDQHRCMNDHGDCALQPRTSFLAVTSVSQSLPSNKINPNEGGAPLLSLSRLVESGGGVTHNECNYDAIEQRRQPFIPIVNNMMMYAAQWKKYRNYSPYLERFHRRNFLKLAYRINPLRTTQELEEILFKSENMKMDEVFALIVLMPQCFEQDFIPDNRFKINNVRVGEEFDRRTSFDTIKKSLEKNKPVLVNFCLNPDAKVKGCHRHSAVIVSQAQVQNKITGDIRLAYWLVNTWGEDWQSAHSDGWFFAENFITGVYGEVSWLETKKQ
jgi:hypothetical protein